MKTKCRQSSFAYPGGGKREATTWSPLLNDCKSAVHMTDEACIAQCINIILTLRDIII